MTSRYRHRRTPTAATAFPNPIEPGEIAVNTANRQLAVGDALAGSIGAPLPLIGVRIFDVRAIYAAGDHAVQAGVLYRAKGVVNPGAFNASQWDVISTDASMQAYVDAGDAAVAAAASSADSTLQTNINAKVAKAGDTMTGHLALPTGPAAANAVRKDYVDAAVAAIDLTPYAPKASPALSGNPTAPTPSPGDNDTSLATTAFVTAAVAAVPAAPVAATAAEYLVGTNNAKMVTPKTAWDAAAPVTLTDGATVTPDFNTGIDFFWTLGAAGRTLANPTNAKPGQKGVIYLSQDATGGRTITTWGSAYKFPGGVKPTLTGVGNGLDVISYVVFNATNIMCSSAVGFA